MEGFTYVDIFATKGIEYILVISALVLFYPLWRLVNTPGGAVYELARSAATTIGDWFHMPEEKIYYHLGHTWAMPEGGEVVKVGIDDFAQKLVGKIDAIKFPEVGSDMVQGERAWSLVIGDKVIDMLSPVDGKVVAVNREISTSPEKINIDPYGAAWLVKVQVPRLSANLRNLLSGKLVRKWMDGVRESLMARMNYNLGQVLQDGGVLVEGIAKNLDREKWDEIVREYFLIT